MTATVPRWALAPTLAMPVLMVGGWEYASRGIPGFDNARGTISDLTRPGAPHRAFMAAALSLLGLMYLATAVALRPMALPGRLLLGLGGLVTAVVSVFPDPPVGATGGSAHSKVAAIGFVLLAVWPVAAWRRAGPGVLRAAPNVAASVLMAALVLWFQHLLGHPERYEGFWERVLALVQAGWPLIIVLGMVRAQRRNRVSAGSGGGRE